MTRDRSTAQPDPFDPQLAELSRLIDEALRLALLPMNPVAAAFLLDDVRELQAHLTDLRMRLVAQAINGDRPP